MAVNIDDATVGMGALGTNQIPYLDLTLRQKAVRDLSVKRKMERERAQGQGWGRGHSRGKGGGKGVYEHPHARGRGQGDRRGSMEICPESANLYRAQLEETVREQEKQGKGAGGAEQVPNAVPGDEDGQEDRAEQERTDSQAHPGADVEMDTRAAAVRVDELVEASGTPMPGVAGGGGGSESDGGEPDPKRRQTMEEVERDAGMSTPVRNREPVREIGKDGAVIVPNTKGWLAKRMAKKAAEAAAAAAEAGGGGNAEGDRNAGEIGKGALPAPVHSSMGPPLPKGKGPAGVAMAAAPSNVGMGLPLHMSLPDAVTYETGIRSGSDHTVDSREWQGERPPGLQAGVDATPQMEGGTGAAATGPAPGLDPPMPGSGAAGGETPAEGTAAGMDTQEDQPVAEAPAEETRPPVEIPEPEEEELVGVKGQVREEMWAIVSVAMQRQGARSDEMFGMMIEPTSSDDEESLTGSDDEESEEMAAEEMDEMEREIEGMGEGPANAATPAMAGLSGELPKRKGKTVKPKGAGSSGELPKKGSGNGEDEDGEGDRAAGERQEAEAPPPLSGGIWTQGITAAVKQQVEAWRRGTVTTTVDVLELRNSKSYAKEETLSVVDGRGNQITWAMAMARLRGAAEKGKLGVVLDAIDAVWDTKGPVSVLVEWLTTVWQGHTDFEEDALVEMETGEDEARREEAKKARTSKDCKFGKWREELSWDRSLLKAAEWPRAIGAALARIMVVWGELGAEATWENGLLAEIIAMGMELQGIAWRADGTDSEEALEQVRAVASRGEQYRRADEAHGDLLGKLRARMESGELDGVAAEEMGKRAGKAVFARRMGMATITMCASQYQTAESHEALEKIGREMQRELESLGGILLNLHLTAEEMQEQWKDMLERRVDRDMEDYEAWYAAEVKVAQGKRAEVEDRLREAAAVAEREVAKVAQEREVRNKQAQKEREEKERENRRPSLHVVLHLENERGYAAVKDLGVLCGRAAMEDEVGCVAEVGEMAIEAMMVVARKWGFDTVTLSMAEGGWRQFPPKFGRQESGLKMHVSSGDPMHMVEYMRRVNDVKMNAGTIEMERDGEDMDGVDDGLQWTQRVQLRTDWGSAELRNDVAPATWDTWQIEVDMGQLKVMESVAHLSALLETLRDEGVVRQVAERLFERVTAVYWSGESFKAKRTGEKYAKYRVEGTGLALAVEQEGHLPVCGKVVSGSGEQETVIAIAYAVMRAQETQKAKCVNCHVAPRTKEGNDHECGNFRDCSGRVWDAMQMTKRTPAATRPHQHQANNRGRNVNRRDKAKGGPQGSRNATHGW
jgi:hypothetical protein